MYNLQENEFRVTLPKRDWKHEEVSEIKTPKIWILSNFPYGMCEFTDDTESKQAFTCVKWTWTHFECKRAIYALLLNYRSHLYSTLHFTKTKGLHLFSSKYFSPLAVCWTGMMGLIKWASSILLCLCLLGINAMIIKESFWQEQWEGDCTYMYIFEGYWMFFLAFVILKQLLNMYIPNNIFSKAILVLKSGLAFSVLVNISQNYVECAVHLHNGLESKIKCRVTLEKMCVCSMCICYLFFWEVSHSLVEKHDALVPLELAVPLCVRIKIKKSLLQHCLLHRENKLLPGIDSGSTLENFPSFR